MSPSPSSRPQPSTNNARTNHTRENQDMNTFTKRSLFATLALGAVAFLADSAQAYEVSKCGSLNVRWAGNSCYFRVDTASMSTSMRSSFQQALNAWNRAPAKFSFSMGSTALWNPFTGNGQNEVWMTSNQDVLDGALGVCFSINACSVRLESDIVFDSAISWHTGQAKSSIDSYSGSRVAFRAVAIHEAGHALGLKHESDTYNVMGDASTHLQTNGSTARSYVGEDATHGAIYLYGLQGGTREDVAVAHWRRSGSASGYSQHRRTRIFIGGVEAPKSTVNGEPVYRLRRGQAIELEMSYENNGKSNQKPRVQFFVSTNDFISTGDQLIGSRTLTVNRNKVYTARHPVTIPRNLTVGTTYWIGSVIDADGRITEFDESNNASYIGFRVIP